MGSIPWQERYKEKLASPQEALKHLRPGGRIFIGSGCAEPRLLVKALEGRAKRERNIFSPSYGGKKPEFLPMQPEYSTRSELADVEVIHVLTLGTAPYVKPELTQAFRHSSFFIGPGARQAVFEGRADYIPSFFSKVPELFRRGRIPIDVALIQVSPPDERGFCSYGVSTDITKAAAESARVIIAEVAPQMPRTLGDSFINVKDIDALVENDVPILEYASRPPDEMALKIAEYTSQLVEDGSTLQIGMGIIEGTILPALRDKRDLGIHTDLLSEGILDLILCGAVTNKKKTIHQGKVIASFCMGTKRLYDFIDNNPLFEFHPTEYTNDPFIISQNDNMVAINAALEVDLTGQACADSVGHLLYSGIGGHTDFIRGAASSKGGKPIIVLPSTTRDGSKSRIVPYLTEGGGVATTRGDVHYVVTEYGIAYLEGKSVRERAMALINIAHPKFRDELLAAAKEYHYVYADQILMPPEARYPKELETYETFKGGLHVFFRPVKPTDERPIQEFLYSLSDQSIYYRFFVLMKAFSHAMAQQYAVIDYSQQMAIVGIIKDEEGNENIIALGQYFLDRTTNMAEIALAAADRYQNTGIGSFLLQYLVRIAKEQGIAGFTASVLPTNNRVMHIFHKCGYPVESTLVADHYSITLKF
jgi:acyl-CoA hydrolase/GNAT superfamily N-acetyltransferase